jgi:RecJ-like exonuclease
MRHFHNIGARTMKPANADDWTALVFGALECADIPIEDRWDDRRPCPACEGTYPSCPYCAGDGWVDSEAAGEERLDDETEPVCETCNNARTIRFWPEGVSQYQHPGWFSTCPDCQ